MLIEDGRYMEPYIPGGIYSELRVAMETRWRLVKAQNSIKNRVKRWLSIYFPEFNRFFGDWEGKAALLTLQEFPTQERILTKSVDEIVASWRKGVQRAVGAKRATKLVEAAKTSIGLKTGLRAAENELQMLLDEHQLLTKQYEQTMALVEELACQIPGVQEILKIKGVGLIMAAGFIAEVRDITRFEHPRQIQKLAGLNIKENSSGKHKGKTTISKRGRKRLKAYSFRRSCH